MAAGNEKKKKGEEGELCVLEVEVFVFFFIGCDVFCGSCCCGSDQRCTGNVENIKNNMNNDDDDDDDRGDVNGITICRFGCGNGPLAVAHRLP